MLPVGTGPTASRDLANLDPERGRLAQAELTGPTLRRSRCRTRFHERRRSRFASALILVALLACTSSAREPTAVGQACTGDEDCPQGFSCWHQLPRGPLAGIPGSPERPGQCWSDDVITQ